MPEGYKPVYHIPCGKLAMYAKVKCSAGSVMHSDDVLYLDGSKPLNGTLIPRCDCGDGGPYGFECLT